MRKFYWARDKNNANDFSSQYGKYNSWFYFIDLAFIALRWAVWELATFIITQWSFLLIEFAVVLDPKYEANTSRSSDYDWEETVNLYVKRAI